MFYFTNQQQNGSKATDLTLQIDKKYKLKLEKLLQYDMFRELIPFTWFSRSINIMWCN